MWFPLHSRFNRFKKVKNKSYQELEGQIAELQKQNETLQSLLSFHSVEEKEDETDKYAHTILNNMGDAVFVKDDESRLLLVNDAFCDIFNLPRAEIIGKTLAENVSPDERESFLKIDKQVLLDGIENINEESLTIDEVEKKILSTRKSRFIGTNGRKFLVGVIRDITEDKKAQTTLKESEVELRKLNATKDKLFSIIAHDLRNPFNNIVSLCEILNMARENSEFEKSETYIGLINSTAKNTLVLLENLLDWARLQSGHISFKSEKINIATVFEEILELSSAIAQTKGITLNVTKSEEIDVFSDPKILMTIMRNLISNAIKYSQTDGVINISAIKEVREIKITISDTGVGMDDRTLKNLFGITTNTPLPGTLNEKGSGFGLVLCKEFVEKLGGKIWVESKKGKGSDFKFTLPLN